MPSDALEEFARQHNIELIYVGWSDSCELTINYSCYISFSDFINKNKAALQLIARAKAESYSDPISVLGPTFKDLSIDESLFSIDAICETILKEYPNETEQFRKLLSCYLRNEIYRVIDVSLLDSKYSNYRVVDDKSGHRLDHAYYEHRKPNSFSCDFEILAFKKDVLQEIAETIKKAKNVFDTNFVPTNPRYQGLINNARNDSHLTPRRRPVPVQPRSLVSESKDGLFPTSEVNKTTNKPDTKLQSSTEMASRITL